MEHLLEAIDQIYEPGTTMHSLVCKSMILNDSKLFWAETILTFVADLVKYHTTQSWHSTLHLQSLPPHNSKKVML